MFSCDLHTTECSADNSADKARDFVLRFFQASQSAHVNIARMASIAVLTSSPILIK
jgi:hypothetical protein